MLPAIFAPNKLIFQSFNAFDGKPLAVLNHAHGVREPGLDFPVFLLPLCQLDSYVSLFSLYP